MVPAGCLSVVMPCFNEERTIRVSLERVLAQPSVGEVVVVDDGSTDRSRELIRASADARVRLVAQPRNFGKGAALRRGLALTTKPYVIIQDADLEYDPKEYPALLEPLVSGQADVVYGSRFVSSQPHRVLYFWHSIGNKVLTLASNMATDLNLTDMETCFKVFRREVVERLIIEEDRFGFEPEVTAKVAQGQWRIFEVGVGYAGRTYAEGKKIGWRDGVRALYCIARYAIPREARALPTLWPGAPDTSALGSLVATFTTGKSLVMGRWAGALEPVVSGASVVDGLEASAERVDTVVLAGALEDADDDLSLLRQAAQRVPPEGQVVAVVAAAPAPFARSDSPRRYDRGLLMTRAFHAGLEVRSITPFVQRGVTRAWVMVAGHPSS